jgi:hypothetical protein
MTKIINPNNSDLFDGKWHHIKWYHYDDTKEDVVEVDAPLAVIDMNNPDPEAFDNVWKLQMRKMIYSINELDEKFREELT